MGNYIRWVPLFIGNTIQEAVIIKFEIGTYNHRVIVIEELLYC